MLAEDDPDYLKNAGEEQIEHDMKKFRFSDIYFSIVGMNMDPRKYLEKIRLPDPLAVWRA